MMMMMIMMITMIIIMMMIIMIMIMIITLIYNIYIYIYIYTHTHTHILGMYYLQRNEVQPVPDCSLGDLGPGGAQRRAEARNGRDAQRAPWMVSQVKPLMRKISFKYIWLLLYLLLFVIIDYS